MSSPNNAPVRRPRDFLVLLLAIVSVSLVFTGCDDPFDDDDGDDVVIIDDDDPPAAPAIAVTPGDQQNVITWSESAGQTYTLYWDTASGVSTSDTAIAGISSPYEHTGLTNGTTYYYRMSASNSEGEGDLSSEASGTPTAPNPAVTVAASDPAASESGPDSGQFTVRLSRTSADDLTITYGIGGTAQAGVDYNSLSGSVVVPTGDTSATIVITPMADSIDEYHETVELALTAGTGYTVGSTSSATVTIAGEDVVIADLGITLKPVAAGTFMMGDLNDAGESNEEPVHEVTLSTGFWMGSTEVTVAQFRAFLQDTDNTDGVDFGSTCPLNNDATYTLSGNAFGTSGDQPMCEISRVASQNFCSWLTTRERAAGRLPATQEYRLPTEAEWEYCCRAGSTTQWCFGNSEAQLAGYAWYKSNANDNTREVAQKTANAWGLYDMHGNVFEWCSDYWGDYSASPVTDPTGPATGTDRVCRGGSWKEIAGYSRSAYRRISDVPGSTNPRLGLRLVRATCP